MRNTDPGAARHERSFLALVPWRNFRRVLFLLLALMGIVALKRGSGGFFQHVLESASPPPRRAPARVPAIETTVHLQAAPSAR